MNFSGSLSDNWMLFEQTWTNYVTATGLSEKLAATGEGSAAGKKQVAAVLCSIMGTECIKVFNALPGMSDADKEDSTVIIQKLREHFLPQKNVLYERFKFNTTSQQPG